MFGNSRSLIFLAIIGLLLFLFFRWYRKFKFPKVNCIALVSGGVKSSKSTFSLALAYSIYKKELLSWKISKFFHSLFRKDIPEKPLLYSNIPLSVPYVPITQSLLLRYSRCRFKSVFFIDEASLVADSQLFKDNDINESLLLFNKLFGHMSHCGHLIYNTQSIGDLHYSIKRCLSEYFYVHHTETRIPFFIYCYVREERYSSDNTVINSYNEDLEDSLKKVLIRKKVWKMFDSCCYSSLTDDKPVEDKEIVSSDLKSKNIVSFRKWRSLDEKKDNISNS